MRSTSATSPETIKMIKLYGDYIQPFIVKFRPSDIPMSVEQFESVVLKFVEEFSSRISGIEIGHANWRNGGAFRLSNSFCEGLVNQLPNLRKLEIYNIADSGGFKKFLVENEDRLTLEDVKLHEPSEVGEPKKMKIQID